MAQYFEKRRRPQATDELKKNSLELQPGMVTEAYIEKSRYPQYTKKLKKGDHRRKGSTEHHDSMSPHSSGNQSIMDLPAGYTAESLNTHLSTLDSPAIQGMDQLREGLSGLSHQQLVNAYIDCMQEREIAQTENLSFRNEAEQSRQKILDLEERLADQESVVREAQESAFALMASKISIAENDDKIYSKLRMIRMQWKNFAKKWASKSMTDIPNKEHVSIRRMVNTWVAPDEYQSHDGIWATENDRKAPSILLNTVLAHFISSNIIRKPFTSAYNLKGGTKTVLYDDVTIMNSLDELYAIKIKEDDVAAHQWRSQTVSFLDRQQRDSTSESPASQQALGRRLEYYEKLARGFERSDARSLYRKCSEEERTARINHVMDLFCSAGDIFSRLWSQKIYIRTLDSGFLLKEPFHIGSDECEAHAAHKLEEDDKSKDGMLIQMVVEPAILAYGNEQGESYEVSKVWGKAVVWLSSGGDSSEALYHTTVSGGTTNCEEEPDELA